MPEQIPTTDMGREVPTSDLLMGSAVLVAFLIGVYGAGRVLSRFRNARFEKAWQPLVPVIAGVVSGDGGGAATSWLSGTYRGRRVRASMVPGRNRYPGESGVQFNSFEAALLDVAGAGLPDGELTSRLDGIGAWGRLSQQGNPVVSYVAAPSELVFSEEVGPGWVPSADRFREELEFLLEVERLNRQS